MKEKKLFRDPDREEPYGGFCRRVADEKQAHLFRLHHEKAIVQTDCRSLSQNGRQLKEARQALVQKTFMRHSEKLRPRIDSSPR